MIYASTSASFIVEQFGLPSLGNSAVEGEKELWNGDDPE